jgi:putative transposase
MQYLWYKTGIALLVKHWKDELFKYIGGILRKNNHKLIAINGMPDHVHVLFGMRPDQSVSDLIQDIKGSSSKWINEKKFTASKFSWQGGYGAFSYSKSQLPDVINYIEKQEAHHKQRTFLQEYEEFLQKFSVDYEQKYIFKNVEY